MTTILGFID